MSCLGCFLDGLRYIVGRILYQPPYWDDVRVPATTTTVGISNPPTFRKLSDNGAGSVGVYAWHFSPTIREDLFFSAQMPHRYMEQTDIKPHIHWAPQMATAGDVYWEMEYTIATVNAVFPNSTVDFVIDASDVVAKKHQVASLTDISMTGNLISTMIHGRISRLGSHASDTYPDDAILSEIDFHFKLDAPGSRQDFIK